MEYFNYFSQYDSGKKNNNGLNIKGLVIFVLIVAAFCVGIYGYYFFLGNRYNSQLDYLKDIRLNEGFNKQYKAAMEVSDKIEWAQNEQEFMTKLDELLPLIGTANPKLMQLIDDCIPEGSYPIKIIVENNWVTILGYAPTVEAVTDIERMFRESGVFSSVLVDTMSNRLEDEKVGMIEFSCEFVLDGGAILDEEINE